MYPIVEAMTSGRTRRMAEQMHTTMQAIIWNMYMQSLYSDYVQERENVTSTTMKIITSPEYMYVID